MISKRPFQTPDKFCMARKRPLLQNLFWTSFGDVLGCVYHTPAPGGSPGPARRARAGQRRLGHRQAPGAVQVGHPGQPWHHARERGRREAKACGTCSPRAPETPGAAPAGREWAPPGAAPGGSGRRPGPAPAGREWTPPGAAPAGSVPRFRPPRAPPPPRRSSL